MADKNVPARSLAERERELLDTVREMKTPAEELFGDAGELACDDAAELATMDEAVRTSPGGGLQPALVETGGVLAGIAAVSSVILVIRNGWTVDIDVALSAVATSVLVIFVGWVIARALFSSGRSASAVGTGAGAVMLAVAGIAYAADLGSGTIAARDVPSLFLALVMLTPGVATLVIAHQMPPQELRENWDDSKWLHRFRGGLRARLVPAASARCHVAEIEQALPAGGTSAYSEFGHPLTLAHEVAAADKTARTRLWTLSIAATVAAPLCIAALVVVNQSWGIATIPVAVVLALVAAGAFVVGWDRRPWKGAR